MQAAELSATRCAICGTMGGAGELYAANFTPDALNPDVFSARRLPDRVHYRLVKCRACGLVRSDPMAPPQWLAQLYARSEFTYSGEVADLRRTYGRYLTRLAACGARHDALLEIGCGNGFFLEEARARGYRDVRGVEPSRDAIERADPAVRDRIVCGLMGPGLFAAGQFDVICLFQVFDHLPDPGAILDACREALKPGGLVLAINHNIGALSARLLGERSPIVDVEHTYLYSHATMARLFTGRGFAVRQQGAVWNTYRLFYLTRLLPLPGRIQKSLLHWLERRWPGQVRLRVPLGNLYLVAQKPLTDASDPGGTGP